MKKTFAMMLALIMVFATVIATLGTTSAAEAEEGFMVATLNDITFDGDLTITKGKNHVQLNETEVIETIGTPHLAEYSIDVTLENGKLGAAYSIEKKELYIGIYALEEVYTVDITVGGVDYTADITSGSVDGGEGYGQVAASSGAYTYEIILPLDEIAIKKVARGAGTDISITVASSMESTFEGQLLFSKYAAGFVYNEANQSANMTLHKQVTDNQDGTVTLVNDGTEARVYSIPNVPNVTKNLVVKFDLTIDSMPYSNIEDVADDAPSGAEGWQKVAAARLWIALKYRFAETLYMNIQNTSDDDLVLNVYENYNNGFDTVKKQHSIVLGKETGEKMVLEFEWSEADADGKYPLNVYVDGVLVGSVENAMNIDAGLGKVSGVLQFNAQWTKTDGSSEEINATWGNISVNEVSALYDADAYNALVNSQAGGNEGGDDNGNDGGNTTPGGDDNAPAGDGNTSAGDDTTDDASDDASEDEASDDASSDGEEEKKGCGSSIAGLGLVAILGSALTAVVASKKKED